MTSVPRGWLPIAAIILCTTVEAAAPTPSAKIMSAELDDIGHGEVKAIVRYVARAPRGSIVKPSSLDISREDVQLNPTMWSQAPVDVDTLVLIDAGKPGHPDLDMSVENWVKRLAEKRPDWSYRFIAGDHNGCLISPEMTNAQGRAAFQTALVVAPKHALQTYPPEPEQMQKMVELFSMRAHTLIVIAPQPPTWLPREVTEWMTPDLAIEDRKPRGLHEQFRVRKGEAEAIHEIAEWIRLGHLQVLIVHDDAQPAQTAANQPRATLNGAQSSRAASVFSSSLPRGTLTDGSMDHGATQEALLRHGVEDILTGVKQPKNPDDFIAEMGAALVEYRGTVTAPVSELQRLASGAYTAKLGITIGDRLYWTKETPVLDRALKNWAPQLLQSYVFYIPLVAGSILMIIVLVEYVRRKGQIFDQDFPQRSRDCLFGCAAIVLAIASNLTANASSRLQYVTCCYALLCGSALVVAGVFYWIVYENRRGFAKAVPPI